MKHSQILKLVLFILCGVILLGCSSKPYFVQTPQTETSFAAQISTIQKISYIEEDNYTRVLIEGSGPISSPLYKLLTDPLRIVIDVDNIDLKQIESHPLKIENGTISEILASQQGENGRIEIGLLQMTNYNISMEEKSLIIDVEKVVKTTGKQEVKKEEEILKETKIEVSPEEVKTEKPIPSAPPMKSAKNIIEVLFEERKDNIVLNIFADGKIDNYNAFKLDNPPRLVLDIWKVGTKKKSFTIKSAYVKGIRIGQYTDKLRLVFDSKKPALPPYQVNRIDDKLIVSLGNNIPQPAQPQIYLQEKKAEEVPTTTPKPLAEVKAVEPTAELKKEEPKEEIKKPEIPEESEKVEATKTETPAVSEKEEAKVEGEPVPEAQTETVKAAEKPVAPVQVAKKEKEEKKISEIEINERVYTGRKLSLDFKDADIKNILRLIAEVSNLNVITGDDVTGKITMRLVDVPWDQALDLILQSKNLGMARTGNVIRIAPVESLKKEVQAELEAKRAKEKMEDLLMELIPVNYATAKEIMPQVKSVLSERGDVKVDERTNILIIKDIQRNIITIKKLVKSLDTRTPQVLIEARILEASLTFQRDLGIRWGILQGGSTTGENMTIQGGLVGGTTPGSVLDFTAVPASGVPGIIEFIYSHGNLVDLDAAISAHESNGNVEIISSPKIATLDNKEATIEQGLRIPYVKYTAEGTATIDFIEANLKLTVTPHVTNDGHIKLIVKVKKDAPDKSILVLETPSIDKKEATTEVLVKDNGIVAIAGVYSVQKTDTSEGVPFFNKIPLLGWLFKGKTKADSRKDLLIFISPKILKE